MTNDTKIWTATPRHKSAKHALDAETSGPATAPSPPPPAPAPKPSPKPKKIRKQRGPLRTLLRALGWGFAGVIGLLLAGGLYITGPLGERSLTALTVGLTNKALASSGLRMELVGITGLWDGEVRVMGLKLFDQKGEWLDLAEGVLYPLWGSVMRNSLDSARALQKLHLAQDPTAQGDILLDLRRITLFDLTFVRPPELIADATPTPSAVPEPLRILPSWLELDVGELEVIRFAFGPANERIYSNIHASARLSDAQGELRLGAFLSPSKRLLQGAPLPEALPGDVTLSRKELAAADAQTEKDSASALTDAFAAFSGNKTKDASKDNGSTADSDGNYDGDNGNAANTPHIKSPDEGMAPLSPSTATGVNNAASPPVPGQEGQQPGQSAPKPQTAGTAQVVFNVVWDGTFADARWQARDTMLLAKIFPGIERLWSRARVQCNLTQWPPSPEYPLQIRLVSRFGLTVKDLKERVRASLCAGQFFWDGQTLVARDLDVRLPLHDPHVTLQGSGGLSRASGPGMRLRLEVGSLSNLVKALGMTHLEQDLGGSMLGQFAVGRGGRHTLWWTRPLPEPQGFAKNPLPGFTAAPMAPELAQLEAKGLLHDSMPTDNHGAGYADSQNGSQRDSSDDSQKNATATATAQRPVTLAVHDPRASLAPTALHTRITLQSDKLKLPGGEVDGFSLVLRGTSLDADSAPEGTMRRKENANKALSGDKKTQTRAKTGAPLPSSAAPAAPAAPAGKDSDSDDFAASGLPRGMVGALELKASSIFAMGDANLRSQWMVGGLHGDADVLLIELSHLVGKLPGSTLGGDVEMSYALPIRRPWPWLDGKLDVAVENWQALKRIIKSPVQGDGMGLSLRMESRFNEKNEPRQYLRAEVKARQVDAPTFSVREVRGDVESDHAHALADLFSLAFTPHWKRKASPEGPPPLDYDLLKARLQLGAGSGGPVQWNSGLCTLSVAGEDARIDANLKGNVRGLLEGVFNFRTRLLQIRKLEVSQGPENDEKGLRLRSPLVAALHENGGLKPVELTLRYGKGIEASARLFAQLQPLNATAGIAQPQTKKAGARDAKSAGAAKKAADEGGDAEADPAQAGKTDFSKNAENTGNGGFGAPETVAEGAEFVPVNRLLMGEARVWGLPGQNAPNADSPSTLTARVQLPLRFAPLPTVLEDGPLGAEIRWQGELEPLWRLLPLPGRSLSGTAAISAGVGGTMARPQVQGAATLRQARYVDKLEGLRLQDITLDMEYGGKDLSRFMLSAADGRGGSMLLRGALLQEGTALLLNAAGSLNRLRPLHRDDLSLSLSGELALRGPLLGVMPEALRAAPPQALPRGKATDVGQLPQKTAKAVGAGDAPGTAADASATVKPEAEQKAQAAQAGIETLLSAPMPPHLLLSGRLRLDEGVFQLLQGFAPSVASLEGVDKGTKPPALTPEWLASLGLHTGMGGAAASAAVTRTVTDAGAAADETTGKATGTAQRAAAQGDPKAQKARPSEKNTQSNKKRNSAGKSATGAVAKAEGATPEAMAGMTVMPLLQLTIDAPGRFFIRGKGLDSEWRAALRVEGSAKAPRLLGSFSPVRGTFELLNRQFRFDGGGIHFNGTWPPNPSLDIALAYKSAQITALVQVLGSARRPRLDLTSQPPLPRDEVMAQVLFGKSMESLSRLETLQAANAARQLVDMGPSALDVMSSARDALGLQVLRLGSGSAAGTKSAPRDASVRGQSGEGQDLGTTLEAGKYITDSVYVGVEQGTKPEAGTAVRVEVELTPNMSLSGRTSQESSGVGLNWKMDY